VWSNSSTVLAAKLPEAVVMGPAMLAAGLLVAGHGPTMRRFGIAVCAIGLLVAASVAWGIATGGVVLGGRVGASPEQIRVQYQIAGLAIASAAGIAAVAAMERRGWQRIVLLATTAALAAAALLPGGRAALLALGLAVTVAPAVLLWRRGAPRAALLWPLACALPVALALLLLLLADPALGLGLRTLERLADSDTLGESSARLPLWRAALAWAGKAAPFGLGTGAFTIAAGFGERRGLYPHNHALEALAEGGLPGIAFWLLAFGGGGLAALGAGSRAEPWRAARVAALTLPMALTVMVSTDLGNRMAWFALGLALGLGVSATPRRAHV
jgi:O-antigen ligase